ncbi:MAG TPA: thiamine pyrophosphate-binding protein [Burkholderiaceae bacterium]|nr:thiamine pyrophosphate-binding protein [Burkholderiaceae bacterium]
MTTGAQLLVEALQTHGVERAFCVPGESYLAVLDALYDVRDQLELVVCRQEGGACYMAEAHGKLTGKPGICFVTRGPGATNASIAVHTAYQDSTPLILFIGQVGNDFVEREAFQEIDYRRMFGPMAKWVAQIDRADRVPEFISHAFQIATSGRPGPVVLALPEDMLTEEVMNAARPSAYKAVQASASVEDIEQMLEMLGAAKQPLLILGGSGWTTEGCGTVRQFAERSSLPVACAFRSQDLFDNRHPCYVGDIGIGINPKLAQRVKGADVLLVIGARLDEMTTNGYTLVTAPCPVQQLIHVHAGADELGKVFQAELLINSGMPQFSRAIRDKVVDGTAWRDWTTDARSDYEKWTLPQSNVGPVQVAQIIRSLEGLVPADTIITNGAGNYSAWVHRFYRYTGLGTQLAPKNGSMGYGVPSAVAAKLAYPQRVVISFSGDGCFLMNGQELATACQYQANVIFIVVNNGMYGTIRLHQERNFPERVWGTDLVNPDFAAYARAFGAHGELVTKTDDFIPALERCMNMGKPSLIEIQIDPNALTHQASMMELRQRALSALGRTATLAVNDQETA